MKQLLRAFALALVAIGAVASTHTTSAAAQTKTVSSMTSATPVPNCNPQLPGACGF